MKVTISDFIISFFDLLEAEAKTFKLSSEEFLDNQYKKVGKAFFKSFFSIFMLLIILLLFFISVVSFAYSMFLCLNIFFKPFVSAFILSIVYLFFGIILLFWIKKKNE